MKWLSAIHKLVYIGAKSYRSMRIKPLKTSSIMKSHCLCDAGFVDKIKYLLCNFLIIFGNHTEFRIVKAKKTYCTWCWCIWYMQETPEYVQSDRKSQTMNSIHQSNKSFSIFIKQMNMHTQKRSNENSSKGRRMYVPPVLIDLFRKCRWLIFPIKIIMHLYSCCIIPVINKKNVDMTEVPLPQNNSGINSEDYG